ncbi:MAG: hypothetical protein JST00_41105 [Deltaproteobacteria bacterium]|nr:hypothetical protein [Deltaproteobacteria bacterium]
MTTKTRAPRTFLEGRAALRADPLLLALTMTLAGCSAAPESEPHGHTESRSAAGSTIGTVKVTHYTLAREADFASESDFLCSGRGVAMQGTGIRRDGSYVKYVSGGGGWCGDYDRLCNCGSARFAPASGVVGASGRTLIKGYSIAVDPGVIPLGSYVWLAELGHWFRADDTGGAIKGMHIDVYTADEDPSLAGSSKAFVTSSPHDANDRGPNGEPASGWGSKGGGEGGGAGAEPAPSPVNISGRPRGGPFEALDVRRPIADGGYITQCADVGGEDERVWQTTNLGKDESSRWAVAKYPQLTSGACGAANDGVHPLVFRSEPASAASELGATWVTQCSDTRGVARVFQVDPKKTLNGHPIAPFRYSEPDPSCE